MAIELKKVLTEKAAWRAVRFNAYTFEVPVSATKEVIAEEVQSQFGVRVVSVRTLMRAPIEKRFRQHRFTTKPMKLAIAQVADGDRIAIYE